MAGKKDKGDGSDAKLQDFTAVMITKSDADRIMKVINWMKTQSLEPIYEVMVSSTPMALDTEFMGSTLFPKVHVKDKVIAVYSREIWGVVLTNAVSTTQEWQLFVLNRNDLASITPWKMKSTKGKDLSASAYFSNNPVLTYSQILARKCPSFLQVDPLTNAITIRKSEHSTNKRKS